MSKARSKKAWSAKEDELICELCKNDISIAMAKMKNRSRDELVLRARVLGLFNEMDLSTWTLTKSHPSVWRSVEVAFLLENKNKPFAKIIQRLPKRSPASCILRLEKLGVAEINPNWTEAAMKVKTAKDKWTDEDIAYLKENFFEDETACAKQLGKSKARCEAKMKELGISRVKNVRYPRWSEEELDYLKAHYLQDGLDVICENLPHRTRTAIISKANQLFPSDKARRWSREEDAILSGINDENREEIFRQLPNRSPYACIARAKSKGYLSRAERETSVKWSADELEILKRYYERMGAVGVAKLLPRKTPIVCYHKAQKLGLEKSESENVEIQQDAAEEI